MVVIWPCFRHNSFQRRLFVEFVQIFLQSLSGSIVIVRLWFCFFLKVILGEYILDIFRAAQYC